jgi:hypothetical protein
MPLTTMNPGTGVAIKSEANGDRSRETIIIASGTGLLLSGTVLGKITATGKYGLYDNDASDGRQTFAAVLLAETDATTADAKAVGFVRDCEVFKDRLVWGAGVTTQAEKDAAYVEMIAAGVIPR